MTKEEAQAYLDSLGPLPHGLEVIVGDGNMWSNKGGIRVYPGLKNNGRRYTPILTDKSNIEVVRQEYIISRFAGSDVKFEDTTKSKLKSLHKAFQRGIIKKNKDFELILLFIKDEIKFKYSHVHINNNNLNFIVPVVNSGLHYEYTAYLTYSISSGSFKIRETGPNKYIPMGKHFIQFQKDLYEKQAEEHKELIKSLKKRKS